MLLAVFGVPTATTALGVRVVQALFNAAFGPYDFLMAGTLEELRDAWLKLSTKNVLFYHEAPGAEVISFLREARAPTIVFLCDPIELASALFTEREFDFLQAIRAASVSISVLQDLSLDNDVLHIDVGSLSRQSLSSFIASIAEHIGVSINQDLRTVTISTVFGGGVQDDVEHERWVALVRPANALRSSGQQDEEAMPFGERCLADYRPVYDGKLIKQVCWHPEMFVSFDAGRLPLNGPVDMTGRQRVLIEGPGMGLPRGEWIADIRFAVSNNLAGAVMLVAAFADSKIALGRVELPVTGSHSCELSFQHLRPQCAVGFQFVLERGVLQGEFSLLSVICRRR